MPDVSFATLFPDAKKGAVALERGEILFRKGDTAGHLYTVERGTVRLVRYSIEGQVVTMHTARSGDSFAEAALFSPIYHCDAEALLPSTVGKYDKNIVLAMLRNSPEKDMSLIALLSRQVRNLRALLEIRSIRSARDRVLHYFLLQADPATMEIHPSGTVKAMSQELGMAHETLYRTLANLEKEGKITRFHESGRIVLHCTPV
jgi:CRP-like cAMP-binding protein